MFGVLGIFIAFWLEWEPSIYITFPIHAHGAFFLKTPVCLRLDHCHLRPAKFLVLHILCLKNNISVPYWSFLVSNSDWFSITFHHSHALILSTASLYSWIISNRLYVIAKGYVWGGSHLSNLEHVWLYNSKKHFYWHRSVRNAIPREVFWIFEHFASQNENEKTYSARPANSAQAKLNEFSVDGET